ncbi:MAG: SRPBCC domain-containing protein [Bacteroidota bacterium]|nr:SRPBCC domain-containing protein [Bacteroidota bacterium]
MAKTIIQKVVFRNTKTKALYDLYMDGKLHGMITAGPVKISEKPGSILQVFGGYITGKTLQVEKNQLIVQQWRGSDWSKKDTDSIFILSFEQRGKNAVMNVIHANVPDDKAAGLDKGWQDHYWKPWKQYLAGKTITRPA